jgi:CheY-like chemotaxis protein
MNTIISQQRPAEILLVEDNESDVELTRQGLRRTEWSVNLHVASNGEECMAFLRKQAPYTSVPTPDLVLLDLNMPRKDGRSVLVDICADEALSRLPVVVLTTSSDEQEILRMYRLRCSAYIVKPLAFQDFVRAIRTVGDFWLTVAVAHQDLGRARPN